MADVWNSCLMRALLFSKFLYHMNSKTSVLLAEDEESMAMIIKESLLRRGFEVSVCGNGNAALQRFEQLKPDIVVLDIMMPLKDGFSVAREIRQHDPHTPIIFLTAKTQTHDVVEGFGIGG